jgi:hypothetical protein
MNQYDNTNRGVLFKNDKEKDTQPDYKGSININGQEFWLSSWIKVSNAGSKFMSLSVTPKDAQQAPSPDKSRIAKQSKGSQGSGFDDFEDTPF